MTYRFLRVSALAGVTLALAAPAVASAHGRFGHHVPRADVRCAAIAAGRTPARLTTDQAAALKAACDTHAAAMTAAEDAYTPATQPAADAYTAAATSLRDQQRTAEQALRSACAADRHAQRCTDGPHHLFCPPSHTPQH